MLSTRIEKIAAWFILLDGWPRAAAILLAGLVTALATPPFDLIFLAFFTFPVLVWSIDSVASEPTPTFTSRLRLGFLPGFVFGYGYFLGGIWWIGNALLVEAEEFAWAIPLAVLFFPAVLALFWGGATAIARLFWSGGAGRLFLLAGCLALAEFLRGVTATGFPWNTLGQLAFFNPLTMQSAAAVGAYGMTAPAVFVFSIAAIFVPGEGRTAIRRTLALLLAGLLTAGHVGYGAWRLSGATESQTLDVTLRVVQPAIAQQDKWRPEKEKEIFDTYLRLSTMDAGPTTPPLSRTDVLIWPESAFPFLLTERRDALAALGALLPDETILVSGALRSEPAGGSPGKELFFNSVYVISPTGEIIGASDKVKLVPFGEFLPFQSALEALGVEQLTRQYGGFAAGRVRKPLSIGSVPSFLALICYEIIFPGIRHEASERPGWILNVTNDAWFGYTPGPFQHARQALVRGVEEGLPVVRAANTGISFIADGHGRVQGSLDLGEQGILTGSLPEALPATPQSRFGQLIFMVVLTMFFAMGLLFRRS